jgi:RES domain-containing protein
MILRSHPEFSELLDRAQRLIGRGAPWSGHAYRTVGPKYSKAAEIISGVGAARAGGRWNPLGAIPAVYASLSPETATAEAFAHNRHYAIPLFEALPRVMVALDVRLVRVLDLTDPGLRRSLRISVARLLAVDWRAEQNAGREAVTQAIGRAAFEAGFQGLLVRSHAAKMGVNIVVFPSALDGLCRLEVLNGKDLDKLRGLWATWTT